METTEALCVTILVFVIVGFIILCLVYYTVLKIADFYTPEVPPPMSLRFSDSFLPKHGKKH